MVLAEDFTIHYYRNMCPNCSLNNPKKKKERLSGSSERKIAKKAYYFDLSGIKVSKTFMWIE